MHLKYNRKSSIEIVFIVIVSGIMMGISNYYFINYLGWICYTGLFYLLIKYSIKPVQAFIIGMITSTIQGMILFSWMINVASNYTGSDTNIGILLTIITAIIFALKTAVFLAIASYIINKKNSHQKLVLITLTIASAYIFLDLVYEYVFEELPWLFHFLGYTQATNLYTAQLTEIAGIAGISSIIIVCNILIAYAVQYKKIKYFAVAIGMIVFANVYGFIRIQSLHKNQGSSIEIALISDNSAPELRWNEQRINEYVSTLLDLNQKAIKNNPDIIIWNEGVIPWSYKEDDDLLEVIMQQTKHSKSQHLISMFTDEDDGSYNSAYLFNNKGEIEGQYNKNQLLGGLEKPLWDNKYLELPFMNPNTSSKMLSGKNAKPIKSSKFGEIGIMLCSESLSESSAAKLSKEGVGFLVLMANDNWFTNTQLITSHFLYTRMRAIETRKDIAINTNLGYCGVINASGKIKTKSLENKPKVITATVSSNSNKSYINLRIKLFKIMSIILFIITIIKIRAHEKN